MPLGCAEIGAVLFGEGLRYNPAVPKWLNRDRFVLSGGHGSMFIYSWLHIAGYKVPRELHLVDEVPRAPSGKPAYPKALQIALAGEHKVA